MSKNDDTISRRDAIDALTDFILVDYPTRELAQESAEMVMGQVLSAEPKEVYCSMASRACFANGKEVAWCLTCPHISEEDRELVKKAVEGSQPETGECKTCKRSSDYRWSIGENDTRCPIEEHYALPKDGYCHLYEPYREDGE